jgi:exosome complex RNA-binding protein Rrp42 (RNase PH superfamily)
MHACSPSERSFVRDALANNFRSDGRTLTHRRTLETRSNILDNLAGSSFVSADLGRVEIYTGVKLRVAESQQGSEGVTSVLLELSCMRRLSPELADCLSYLQQLLQEHFINRERALAHLTIPNAKRHHLELHIQAFLLSEPHPSLLEPLYASIRVALLSTALPTLHCFLNEVTNEETVEVGTESKGLEVGAV